MLMCCGDTTYQQSAELASTHTCVENVSFNYIQLKSDMRRCYKDLIGHPDQRRIQLNASTPSMLTRMQSPRTRVGNASLGHWIGHSTKYGLAFRMMSCRMVSVSVPCTGLSQLLGFGSWLFVLLGLCTSVQCSAQRQG